MFAQQSPQPKLSRRRHSSDNLYRMTQSSRAQKTESVSVMGQARSAAVCSTKWDEKL